MPAFNPSGCVDALAIYLDTVAGISGGDGRIHKQRRMVRSEPDIRAQLAGNGGKVNSWMITPAAANTTLTERNPGFNAIGQQGGGRVLTTFQFVIEAYYQLLDAEGSEQTFRDLAWAVVDGLNAYGSLNIPGVILQLPADIEQFGYIMVANVGLYHYARVSCGWRGQTRP